MEQMAVAEGDVAKITIGLWLLGAPVLPESFRFSVA